MPAEVVIRPRQPATAAWGLAALALVSAGVFLVVDTGGELLAWLSLAAFAVVAAWFLAQLVRPSLFAVTFSDDAVLGRAPWKRRRVPWDVVEFARIRRILGDPVLEIFLRPTASTHKVIVPLPLTADVARAREELVRRLRPLPGATAGIRPIP